MLRMQRPRQLDNLCSISAGFSLRKWARQLTGELGCAIGWDLVFSSSQWAETDNLVVGAIQSLRHPARLRKALRRMDVGGRRNPLWRFAPRLIIRALLCSYLLVLLSGTVQQVGTAPMRQQMDVINLSRYIGCVRVPYAVTDAQCKQAVDQIKSVLTHQV
jgi:hypothetical protein